MPNRIILLITLLFTIAFAGCNKNNSDPEKEPKDSIYKIEVYSGLNQTDTAGHILKEYIRTRVYKNGRPYGNSKIRFIGLGCTGDYAAYSANSAAGQNVYNWFLNEKPGVQTLRIILCDSVDNPLDSIKITATAIAPSGNGLQLGACSVGSEISPDKTLFFKLRSGRILSLYHNREDSYYYSDDNGLSWNLKIPVPNTFPKNFAVAPNGDVYMFTQSITENFIYKSKDEGSTWSQVYKVMKVYTPMSAVYYLPSGKLIFTVTYGSCYVSVNDGVTWREGMIPTSNHGPLTMIETNNGNIYAVARGDGLFKSSDGGLSWKDLSKINLQQGSTYLTVKEQYSSILLDNKNDIYVGRDNEQPGICKINEASNTAQLTAFNGDIFSSLISVTRLTQGPNGYYYFFISLKGIYRTKDFVNYELIKKEKGYQVRDFIIANNNNVIIANGDYGHIYYMKQ